MDNFGGGGIFINFADRLAALTLPIQLSLIKNNDSAAEKAKDFLTDITTLKITKAGLVVLLAYLTMAAVDKFITWVSEKVPRQFRLTVKQSLPFCRAAILLLSGSYLLNLFVKLSPSNFLAISGTAAVAIGFAFKDYASSVIAGVITLFESTYQVGDRVRIGEYYGEVVGYGLRGIRLLTGDGCIVKVPHNTIWTSPIVNVNTGKLESMVVTDFYFNHDVDVNRVMHILYRVAQTSKYTQLSLPISVLIKEKPWGTHFELRAHPMDARDELVYITDLLKRAKQELPASNSNYGEMLSHFSEFEAVK
nr:mechanosensitive ion channel domain-containing protein [Pseudanabaena sp. PCC 7367]